MSPEELQDWIYQNIRDWATLQKVIAGLLSESFYVPSTLPRDGLFRTNEEMIEWMRAESLPNSGGEVSDEQLFVWARAQLRRQHLGPDSDSLSALFNLFDTRQPPIVEALLGDARNGAVYKPRRVEHTIQLRLERDDRDRVNGVRIAYYESLDKAVRDIRVVTTPERWATRAKGCSAEDARDFGAALKTHFVETADHLYFARTVAEIQHVYAEGPSSCMDGSHDFQTLRGLDLEVNGDSVTSPVACYCSPDLAVAYLKRDARITARAVTNEKNKTWARCYGDVESLVKALEAADYLHDMYALSGCRLRHISSGDSRLQPFVDYAGAGYGRKDPYGNNASTEWGQLYVSEEVKRDDDGEWRIIVDNGRGVQAIYETGFAEGYGGGGYWTCGRCNDEFNDNEPSYQALNHRYHEVQICHGCRDDDYVEARDSEYGWIYVNIENAIAVDGTYYTERDAPEYHICDHCSGNVTETTEVITDGQDESTEDWCGSCVNLARRHGHIHYAETTDEETVLTQGTEIRNWGGRDVTIARHEQLEAADADECAA